MGTNCVLEVVKRYTEEDDNSNLSCGGNISYLALKTGENVLDLGCGRGTETLEAAKLVGATGLAWGLDVTPKMIEVAIARAQESQAANTRFLVGQMEAIPLENASLDAVLSNCAINHVADKAAVYREIFRVLKPGGRFVVSDIMTDEPLPEQIKNDPEAVAACFGGAITVEEYDKALTEAGFLRITVYKERRYMKNGYGMISRTFSGQRP